MLDVEARLHRLERRDWWFWSAAIFVMLLLTVTILSLALPALWKEGHPLFRSGLQEGVLGLLALVALFGAYVINQQLLVKRLRNQLTEHIASAVSLQVASALSVVDPATGLYNRDFLDQHLPREMARARRAGYPLNALLLDLNNFKQINEMYGKPAGDAVLKEFADHLKKSVRTSDLSVRMGPDEFLILSPESSPERVPHILARLSGLEVEFQGLKIPLSFAAGWTTYEPDEPPDRFLLRVQQQVQEDRQAGRSVEAIREAQAEIRQGQDIEALGRLAKKVAHDFNNLLGLVKGYSELLLGQLAQGDPNREYIEQIHRANERANSLTRHLLAFTGHHGLVPETLDLNVVIAGLGAMLRRLVGEPIELTIKPGQPLGLVKVHRGQIEQVILDVVLNAREMMPQGGKLTLETANAELDEAYSHWHPGARPGSYVMLAVRDTGAGIDSETLAHIFQPFLPTKTKAKGSGLGLAAVYGIIKQNGGYVSAESEVDRGTTFTIYLPRLEKTASVSAATGDKPLPT